MVSIPRINPGNARVWGDWWDLLVGEPGAGLDREVVKHEEGREVAQLRRAHGPSYPRPGALGLLGGEEDLANGSRDGLGHVGGDELLLPLRRVLDRWDLGGVRPRNCGFCVRVVESLNAGGDLIQRAKYPRLENENRYGSHESGNCYGSPFHEVGDDGVSLYAV